MTLPLSALILMLVTAPDPLKPAAVTVCFTGLSPATPLYSPSPLRNYRKLTEDSYLLDLDVTFNEGVAPLKVTKAPGTDCLKAWLPAQPVTALSVSFNRTDLNLGASPRKVNLKLKPDLWYDGGAFATEVLPFARVTASRPGTLTLRRHGPAAPGVPTEAEDAQRLPAGNYLLDFVPKPPPEVACELELTAEARGTVTPQRHPEVLAQVLDTYRRDFAPAVLGAHKIHCHKGEQIRMKVSVYDGVVVYPLAPSIQVMTRAGYEPRYRLVRAASAEPFELGGPVSLAAGESVTLETLPTPDEALSARASATSP